MSVPPKKSTPAIPLFGDAYLADTRHLSLEEHGAYLQLLMIAWRIEGCCLPDDDARLSRMLSVTPGKWKKLKPAVMAFWECSEGQWRQRRLTKERAFVEEKSATNRASAEARWKAKPLENIEGDECERMSERNAPPPPPPKEEGSVAKATGGEAADPIKQMFDLGVSVLTGAGHKEREARSLVGKWAKAKGEGGEAHVIAALLDCRAKGIVNPVEWIEARFKSARFVSESGYEYRGSARDVMLAAEKRSDWGTYYSAKAEIETPQSTGPPRRRSNGKRGEASSIGQLVAGIGG